MIATNATSTNFSNSAEGGNMSPLRLEQGVTRTIAIRADVDWRANRTAQFRFDAGTPFAAGSAVWSVTNSEATRDSSWTVLPGNVPDVTSPTLVSH